MQETSRSAAVLYGATVVNISYRLALRFKLPTAPQDVWDSMKWILENYESLGADRHAELIVSGVSAGGNLAAVCGSKDGL